MVDVGHQAPDFSLADTSGRRVVLSELRRRGPVVLVFYRGHWCPFCRRHLKRLQEHLGEIRSRGAAVVAVSSDERVLARRLSDELGLEYPVLSDLDGAVMDAYGVRNRLLGIAGGIPHASVFIIDVKGIVRFREVRRNYRRRTAPARLVRVLDEVMTRCEGELPLQ